MTKQTTTSRVFFAVCCAVALSTAACGGSADPTMGGKKPSSGPPSSDASADAGQGSDTGPASDVDCAAVQSFTASSDASASVALAWAGAAQTAVAIYRKSYCGTDAYALLTMLPAGATSYTDTTAQANWVYWYEITAINNASESASNVVAIQAGSTTSAASCTGGSVPQASGVVACLAVAPMTDGGMPTTPDSGTSPDPGSLTGNLPDSAPPGATVVTPASNVVSAVQACAGGTVYFSPGTYTLTTSMNVPANCTIMGAPKWTSIITGGTNSDLPVFQTNDSSNITFERLNFQNVNSGCIGNYDGQGLGNNTTGTHVQLNLFEHFPDNVIPIWFFDPKDLLIERNAFNDLKGDSIHLFSRAVNTKVNFPYYAPSSNVVVRWNFGANQSTSSNFLGAFIEIQLASAGLEVYENVYYSESTGRYEGMALSIASGGIPCTSTTSCLPLDNGKNGVTIDGNIILDNNVPAGVTGNMGAIEVMGVMPLMKNNYIRHWAGLGMYTWLGTWNQSNDTYGGPGTVEVDNNVGCGAYQLSSYTLANEGFQNSTNDAIYSGNQYQANCANGAAPPALPPQIVVPPDLLDNQGGMNAIANSSVAGPNTYWPKINVASGL